jgi:hypothetical protein
MTDLEQRIFKQAIGTLGIDSQVDMAIEECSELIVALEHWKRGRCAEDHSDIITEIADVKIMCDQLSIVFGEMQVDLERGRKVKRLKERLEKYEREN